MEAMDAALEAGLSPDAETRLRVLLLGLVFDGFHRSVPWDLKERMEPSQWTPKTDEDLVECKSEDGGFIEAKTK